MLDPLHILSLIFHLLATVIWVGGLLLMTILLLPEIQALIAARKDDNETSTLVRFLDRFRRRFYPLANLSLGVLIVTGIYQMERSPYYDGVLGLNNDWSRAIFVKHLAVLGMVGIGAIMQFSLIPALDRAALLRQRGKDAPELERLRVRERHLIQLNTALGVFVLICTAAASSL
ncbi:MAG TPA: CopD family protein [Aggregatilineales bacterium]|nr:CopD family protein [Aggregatilineales bacterium]